jgi:hypothetical protein
VWQIERRVCGGVVCRGYTIGKFKNIAIDCQCCCRFVSLPFPSNLLTELSVTHAWLVRTAWPLSWCTWAQSGMGRTGSAKSGKKREAFNSKSVQSACGMPSAALSMLIAAGSAAECLSLYRTVAFAVCRWLQVGQSVYCCTAVLLLLYLLQLYTYCCTVVFAVCPWAGWSVCVRHRQPQWAQQDAHSWSRERPEPGHPSTDRHTHIWCNTGGSAVV